MGKQSDDGDFDRHWKDAVRMLKRAIHRGPPIAPADQPDLEQEIAVRLIRARHRLHATASDAQRRSYLKRVAESVRLDYFKSRRRWWRAEGVTKAAIEATPKSRQGDEFSGLVVRELLERFPSHHFALAVQPLWIHAVPPLPAKVRKQQQRSRDELVPVIRLVTGYNAANKK